jgi:hypothetical protein
VEGKSFDRMVGALESLARWRPWLAKDSVRIIQSLPCRVGIARMLSIGFSSGSWSIWSNFGFSSCIALLF